MKSSTASARRLTGDSGLYLRRSAFAFLTRGMEAHRVLLERLRELASIDLSLYGMIASGSRRSNSFLTTS
jgi:hypothetical protein